MRKIIFPFLVLSFSSLVSSFAQTADENNGFYSVKYAKDTVRIGQEFRIFYASESGLKNFKAPSFDASKFKVGAESLPYSAKDRPWVKGKRVELDLEGYSFFVTPVDTGACVIPGASAKVNGKHVESPSLAIYVLPLYEELQDCELKLLPSKPHKGVPFEFVITSRFRFDVNPVVVFDSLTVVNERPKVGMTMDQSGSRYTYTYKLVADHAGTYTIPAFDVFVSRKVYTLKNYVFEVKD